MRLCYCLLGVWMIAAPAALVPFAAASADELGDQIRRLHERISPALVAVKVTYESDDGERREFELPGIIVTAEGLTMFPAPDQPLQQMPRDFFKKFEIIRADRLDEPITAALVSFDAISEVGFIAPVDTATDMTYIDVLMAADAPKLGQRLISFGLMPEALGRRCAFAVTRAGPRYADDKLVISPWPNGFPSTAVVDLEGRLVATASLETRFRMGGPQTLRLATAVGPAVRYVVQHKMDRPEPWLGVAGIEAATREIREFYEVPEGRSAISIGHVIEGYPAEQAGLDVGDLIVGFDGKPLRRGATEDETARLFLHDLKHCEIGQAVSLTVWRDEKEVALDVTLGKMPPTAAKAPRRFSMELGLAVRQIVFQDTFPRKLPPDQPGVIVARLVKSGPAQTGGVQPGDIIRKLQDRTIQGLEDYQHAVDEVLGEKPAEVVMSVLRGRSENVVVRIELSGDRDG
ncbi:MAG: PDZ domain-containing protein [Phycisphaerae bacterium]